MSQVVSLTYSPFAENTYLIYDDTRECVIIDPGCYTREEEKHLVHTIELHGLKPVRLLNTHGHIDHVFGNRFVLDTWKLEAEIHAGEQILLDNVAQIAQMYGIPMRNTVPTPGRYLEEGEEIRFGKTVLTTILAPGHSPAHLCFYCAADNFLIGGDVLFQGSIGRTDLPLGNHEQLLESIQKKIYTLPDETIVYSGHGDETTIGWEAKTNPFVKRS